MLDPRLVGLCGFRARSRALPGLSEFGVWVRSAGSEGKQFGGVGRGDLHS